MTKHVENLGQGHLIRELGIMFKIELTTIQETKQNVTKTGFVLQGREQQKLVLNFSRKKKKKHSCQI